MKKKILAIAAVALIPALLAVFNSGKAPRVPSDLRDAVADNSAMGQIGYSRDIQAVAPSAPEAMDGGTSASSGFFSKGADKPNFAPSKRTKSAADPVDPSLSKLAAANGLTGKPPYEVLAALFEKGIPATQKDLAGWHAGRTLATEDKGKFIPSLLVMRKSPVNPGGGPLFENEFMLEIISKMKGEQATDYFDTMNAETVKAVKADLADDKGSSISFPEAIVAFDDERASARLEYRKTGSYIFERWNFKEGNKEWVTMSYAYFFKNVTPP